VDNSDGSLDGILRASAHKNAIFQVKVRKFMIGKKAALREQRHVQRVKGVWDSCCGWEHKMRRREAQQRDARRRGNTT